jgi:hypothetical protein
MLLRFSRLCAFFGVFLGIPQSFACEALKGPNRNSRSINSPETAAPRNINFSHHLSDGDEGDLNGRARTKINSKLELFGEQDRMEKNSRHGQKGFARAQRINIYLLFFFSKIHQRRQ